MNDILPETNKSDAQKRRNLLVIGAVGAAVLVALLYGVFQAMPNLVGGQDLSQLKVGKMAALEFLPEPPPQPQQLFKGPDGADTNLSAFRGKVVLVNLWATWCAPCVTEMPMLAKLQTEFANKDFLVVTVSVDRENDREEAKARLAELSKGGLPFFHDPRMSIVYPMKARGFPTSVLYDRNGVELARLAGEAQWNSPEAFDLIDAALLKNRYFCTR